MPKAARLMDTAVSSKTMAELTVWPGGTRAGGYRFQHALYQQVLYE